MTPQEQLQAEVISAFAECRILARENAALRARVAELEHEVANEGATKQDLSATAPAAEREE